MPCKGVESLLGNDQSLLVIVMTSNFHAQTMLVATKAGSLVGSVLWETPAGLGNIAEKSCVLGNPNLPIGKLCFLGTHDFPVFLWVYGNT